MVLHLKSRSRPYFHFHKNICFSCSTGQIRLLPVYWQADLTKKTKEKTGETPFSHAASVDVSMSTRGQSATPMLATHACSNKLIQEELKQLNK